MLLIIEQGLLLFRRILIDFSINDHFIFYFLAIFIIFSLLYLLILPEGQKLNDLILIFILCLFCFFNKNFINFPLLLLLALPITRYSIKFYASINVVLILIFIGILFICLFFGIIENEEHYYLNKTTLSVNDFGLRSANNFPTYIIFLEIFTYLLIYDSGYKKKWILLLVFFIITAVVYTFSASRGSLIAIFAMVIAELCPCSLRKIILKNLNFIIIGFLLLTLWFALYGSQNNEINQIMSTRPRCWLMFIQNFSVKDYCIGNTLFDTVSKLGYNVDSTYLILLGRNGILGYCIVWYLVRQAVTLNLNFLVLIFPIITLVLLTSFYESYFYGVGISTVFLLRLTLSINNTNDININSHETTKLPNI